MPQKHEMVCVSCLLLIVCSTKQIDKIMEYLQRIIDKELQSRLRYIGAVLIEGPKWCGKTTTATQQANSVLL
jgi:predicted AAA+ superfamily ATPase